MVTKDRLAKLIGQQFYATAKTAIPKLRKLADEQEIFYCTRPCKNDNAPVFECIFGTYKTKVFFIINCIF